MKYAVEQQTRSGLGELHWLRVAGPFDTRAEAERVHARLSRREPFTRVADIPQ